MANISQSTQKLIKSYQFWHQSLQRKEGETTLHVDEVASRVAAFYEKIRGVIDWREEHLIRKTAIERILKRRLFLAEDSKDIASPFLLELIRGGHFPNDSTPEPKVEEVQRIIDKFSFILKNFPELSQKEKLQLADFFLGIAACEVEECLSPPLRERALIDYMTEIIEGRIEIKEGALTIGGVRLEERNTQIYIAVQRALYKFDNILIAFHLLERRFPQWSKVSIVELQEIIKNIFGIWQEIEQSLRHPLAEKFYKIAENYDTAYLILGDIISENSLTAQDIISNPESLEILIRGVYQKRLRKSREKVRRAALYSTISIFITKMLLALTAEAGFERVIAGGINYLTLGLNISIPPILMGLLIISIRPPSKENLQRVTIEVMKIVYEREKKDTYKIKPYLKRGFLMTVFLLIFYSLSFIISFGIIIWGLLKLKFNTLSIIIFLVFLSLILFAGTRIRQRAKELEIGEEKESILSFIFDFLTLPIVRVGKWLSSQWERYNVLVVVFNLLIELPFQFFTEFLEQLRYFWKEKKEEIH